NTQLAHELVTSADFSEKLTLRYDNEVQAMYRHTVTMALLIIVVYFIHPDTGEQEVETHCFFSEDPTQDAPFVNLAYKLLLQNLAERLPALRASIRAWFRWSDNCASQFKCADAFLLQSQWLGSTGLYVQQDYTEASHGKGLHDSEGGIVKRAVNDELRRQGGELLKTAEEVVGFCSRNLSVPASQEILSGEPDSARIKQRNFYLLTAADIQAERQSFAKGSKPVPQTQKVHSVQSSMLAGAVGWRLLSCYCDSCRHSAARIDTEDMGCANTHHVSDWEVHELQPPDALQRDREAALLASVKPGEVVALANTDPVNYPQYEYCLMEVSWCGEIEDNPWKDGDGVTFPVDTAVIKGRWLAYAKESSKLQFIADKGGRMSGARLSDLIWASVPFRRGSKGVSHIITAATDATIREKMRTIV
ncbi:hypothetical protein Agub_g6473, partial [Astrephomene gubernaculifera]